MTPEEFDELSPDEQRNFYRCPACGEMVDNRRLDEIVLHHSHVLHPNRLGDMGSKDY
jgi:hypothetical protein